MSSKRNKYAFLTREILWEWAQIMEKYVFSLVRSCENEPKQWKVKLSHAWVLLSLGSTLEWVDLLTFGFVWVCVQSPSHFIFSRVSLCELELKVRKNLLSQDWVWLLDCRCTFSNMSLGEVELEAWKFVPETKIATFNLMPTLAILGVWNPKISLRGWNGVYNNVNVET